MHLTVLSATNRPGSNTRKVAGYIQNFLQENLPKTDAVEILDLQDLPPEIFSPRSYDEKPKSFEKFANLILQTDGIICVVPEYNGGFPGVFKYFIDMLPFPASLQKKPAAFVGVAMGKFGALRAVEQMQAIWGYRHAHLFTEKVLIPAVDKEIDADGRPVNPSILKLLHSELNGFVEFSRRLKSEEK